MGKMLWMVIVVLLVIWLLGLVLEIGGALIHLILLIAGIILIVQLVTGKRKL
ncbi:lmo0937 family membrane protein [Paenisporosarcina indica]|uniref:lmo0937 family membrane protein n=1 Tax=Paenisporosarcina indica TaxID=650093 RepID=UPI000B03A533|nr:lmo0937 family membrane protein [Paenisporosarcina indica]